MIRVFERLESALKTWEDVYFFAGINARLQEACGESDEKILLPLVGPTKYSGRLREHLLGLRSMENFDAESFVLLAAVSESLPKDMDILRAMSLFPVMMASWTCASRRVYRIDRDLDLLLGATDLGDIRWADVSWPFGSFAIDLEVPFVDYMGNSYDCILLSRIPKSVCKMEEDVIGLSLIPTCFIRAYRVLTDKQKQKMFDASKQRRWQDVRDLLVERESAFCRHKSLNSFYIRAQEKSRVGESLAVISYGKSLWGFDNQEMAKTWGLAARIAVGLCLYLNMLPLNSGHRSDWKPENKTLGKPDPKAITNGALVCAVSSIHKLVAGEREVLETARRLSSHELCAHHRRGHWRRPPGFGGDPNASKTIWVRPTFVRKDRLQDGQLPGGAEHVG